MTVQQFVISHPRYQFLPISKNKRPACETWSKTEKLDYDFSKCFGIGLLCGEISDEIETLDIDCKYDLTGHLYKNLKAAITKADPTILPQMTVQKTPNGGYHFIYKCKKRQGNVKLARRNATDEELKKAPDAKVRVLIETRGDGGYIGCFPTPGYELIYGDFEEIKYLTPEQRDTMFEVCGVFNEYFEKFVSPDRAEKKNIKGTTPFEDYNERGDIEQLLVSHGWEFVNQKGPKTFFLRPGGDSKASHSGNFDRERNQFSVFSTSTIFEPETAYQPYAVYTYLECGKNLFKEASRKLYDLGYGDRFEKVIEQTNNKVPSKINLLDDDLSFLATEKDYNDYLISLRTGTFQKGLSTGIKALDEWFLLKENNFVTINGFDNVGKSVVIWYIALLSAMIYGWKWVIFSSENTVGGFYRKMIEFYWCESIESISDEKYKQALEFIKKHFKVILSGDELYNYHEIILMTQKVMRSETINGLLIDPYNSLKIELATTSKLNTHEYHYEAISELKLFGKRYEISIYINCHAITAANRNYGKNTHLLPPQKGDTEGGTKFSNKTDDFLTIHRKIQSKEDWMITEIYVRKIKEVETGGRVTPYDEPVKLRAVNKLTGFCDMDGFNAILNFHNLPQDPYKKPTNIQQTPINDPDLFATVPETDDHGNELPF